MKLNKTIPWLSAATIASAMAIGQAYAKGPNHQKVDLETSADQLVSSETGSGTVGSEASGELTASGSEEKGSVDVDAEASAEGGLEITGSVVDSEGNELPNEVRELGDLEESGVAEVETSEAHESGPVAFGETTFTREGETFSKNDQVLGKLEESGSVSVDSASVTSSDSDLEVSVIETSEGVVIED